MGCAHPAGSPKPTRRAPGMCAQYVLDRHRSNAHLWRTAQAWRQCDAQGFCTRTGRGALQPTHRVRKANRAAVLPAARPLCVHAVVGLALPRANAPANISSTPIP
eukprot:scaffold911_cov361-Prasinococcus_capsulatus_cf.AAC.21